MSRLKIVLAVVALLSWSGPVLAEYTLVLKNGRRITVQSYREEGGMIKFQGLGGEIGISKAQIQTILKPGEQGPPGLVVHGAPAPPVGGVGVQQEERAAATPGPPSEAKPEEKREGPQPPEGKAQSPEERLAEERAREEKEYQKRIKEITEQLKAVRDRYLLATRGSSGPEPILLQGEEAIRSRTEDLMSRLRDAQHNPGGPSDAGGVTLTTPSTFAGGPPAAMELRPGELIPRVDVPLPEYSGREKDLSDLRNQIGQLEKERERLIQEMRGNNFDTGGLFLE